MIDLELLKKIGIRESEISKLTEGQIDWGIVEYVVGIYKEAGIEAPPLEEIEKIAREWPAQEGAMITEFLDSP